MVKKRIVPKAFLSWKLGPICYSHDHVATWYRHRIAMACECDYHGSANLTWLIEGANFAITASPVAWGVLVFGSPNNTFISKKIFTSLPRPSTNLDYYTKSAGVRQLLSCIGLDIIFIKNPRLVSIQLFSRHSCSACSYVRFSLFGCRCSCCCRLLVLSRQLHTLALTSSFTYKGI